ncbi:hypothetical protein niasHT_019387 [Heterodera trifolii]|uniref:Hexosyltransferase n=1 Tax=Heterodera trifolii TaxID=157864 RepID=A0ABD2KVV6_9BILA
MGTNRIGILLLFFCITSFLVYDMFSNGTKSGQINVKEYKKADNWQETTTARKMGDELEKIEKNGTEKSEKRDEEDEQFEIRFKNIRLKYRMEFENECPDQTKLIILSMSRRDAFEKRKGIRQTWMKDAWYGGLQWQQSFCAGAEWVMKADDDSIVHLRRLAYWTENKFRPIAQQNPLVYFGHLNYWPNPIRDPKSKWFASVDMYAGDKYPKFLQGTVYLATAATIGAILPLTPQITGFCLDDVVFTGILAELANVTVSEQKEHFVWEVGNCGGKFGKFGHCEDGVPATIAMWGVNTVKEYQYHYGRLQSAKCKWRGTTKSEQKQSIEIEVKNVTLSA